MASLAVIDGDGNGKIDSADAVFNNLVVWQDANGNGRMDDGEGKALAALGISSLNYEAGTVTRNGQATQMHTLTLDADTLGTSFTHKGDGIDMDYLENDSDVRPYDGDIGTTSLKDWSVEGKAGLKAEKPRDCLRSGIREMQRFQGKTKQCQRHMVTARYEKYNEISCHIALEAL